jgi:hypothetical protein
MVGPEVLAQQVAAEVILEIAPYGMYVVAVVLGVVELDQEGRTLHAVVVLLATLDTARPGECDVPGSGSPDPGHALGGNLGRHQADKGIQHLYQGFLLRLSHGRGLDALG